MLFVVLCIAGGVLIGFALGGSLRRLEALALRRVWLLVLAVVVQIVASLALSHGAFTTALIASLVLAVAFLLSNPQLSGKTLICVGLGANALVIAVNGAMPVSLDAAAKAGISTGKIADDARHQIAEPGTHLSWLDDHIPLALPGEPEALSPGDIAVAAGAALMVVAAMRRRMSEPAPIPRRPSAEGGAPDPNSDPSTDELPVLAAVGAIRTAGTAGTVGSARAAETGGTLDFPGDARPLPLSAPIATPSDAPVANAPGADAPGVNAPGVNAPAADVPSPGPTPFLTAAPATAGSAQGSASSPLSDPVRRSRLPRRRPASEAASPPVVRPAWTPLPVRTPGAARPQPTPGAPSEGAPSPIPASYRSPAPGANGTASGITPTEPLEPGPAALRRRTATRDPAQPALRLNSATGGVRPAPTPGSPLARLATPIASRADDPGTLGPMELQPEPLSRRASRAPTPPSEPDPPQDR